MESFKQYIQELTQAALNANQRAAICLEGSDEWLARALATICDFFPSERIVQLGGHTAYTSTVMSYKQGNLLLGNEHQLILVDLADGLDANSFAALTGTLVGGGLLCLVNHNRLTDSYADRWFCRALQRLICLREGDDFSLLPVNHLFIGNSVRDPFSEQKLAIDAILKVLNGHRKRPLVLSADRGRGKTSALGLAAAQAILARPGITVLICAPNATGVSSAFYHARQLLGEQAISDKYGVYYQASQFTFIAPDTLISQQPKCDLLLIDEAAAIPLPMLQLITEHYHRVVFSSTLHGYEGCGLGFTHKFIKWLSHHRPGFNQLHLCQPIRWAENDYLESWLNDTFFINVVIQDIVTDEITDIASQLNYRLVDQSLLFASPLLFGQIFSILVNAHYQTTPNDLMLILGDPAISVFVAEWDGRIVACLLIAREGNLSDDMVDSIKLGRRRPKGQLVPVTLINQLGCYPPACLCCDRIMRIATHPQLQHRGIGSALLRAFIKASQADYLATSFGLTAELLSFWGKNSFLPVKLGSQKDNVSGSYSLLMLQDNGQDWMESLFLKFDFVLLESLATTFQTLSYTLVNQLRMASRPNNCPIIPCHLIDCYAQGGADYESVEVWIRQLFKRHTADSPLTELMLAKILQNQNWPDCVSRFGFTGKKQAEERFRKDLAQWLDNLQCKS